MWGSPFILVDAACRSSGLLESKLIARLGREGWEREHEDQQSEFLQDDITCFERTVM
jgi:hypothetical protein